jgi:hypothetical protein
MTTILHTKNQGLRVHKLANLGGLVAMAGLENIDPGILLGLFLQLAKQLPTLSHDQIEILHANGLQKLRERGTEKRAYSYSKKSNETSNDYTLSAEDIKKLIVKLGGTVPVFEKDLLPELHRFMR